jgi:hypothetical protein
MPRLDFKTIRAWEESVPQTERRVLCAAQTGDEVILNVRRRFQQNFGGGCTQAELIVASTLVMKQKGIGCLFRSLELWLFEGKLWSEEYGSL